MIGLSCNFVETFCPRTVLVLPQKMKAATHCRPTFERTHNFSLQIFVLQFTCCTSLFTLFKPNLIALFACVSRGLKNMLVFLLRNGTQGHLAQKTSTWMYCTPCYSYRLSVTLPTQRVVTVNLLKSLQRVCFRQNKLINFTMCNCTLKLVTCFFTNEKRARKTSVFKIHKGSLVGFFCKTYQPEIFTPLSFALFSVLIQSKHHVAAVVGAEGNSWWCRLLQKPEFVTTQFLATQQVGCVSTLPRNCCKCLPISLDSYSSRLLFGSENTFRDFEALRPCYQNTLWRLLRLLKDETTREVVPDRTMEWPA